MPVDPEVEHSERRGVDRTNTIGLTKFEGESCILVEPDFPGHASGAGAGLGTEILSVVREVDEGSVFGHKLSVSLSERRTVRAPYQGLVQHL